MRRASFVHDQDRFLIDLSTWNPLELGRDSGRHAWDGYHVDAARLGLAVRASKPEATKEDHHIVVDPFPAGGRNGNLMGFINDPHVRGVVSGTDPDTTLTGKVGKSNAVVEEVRCFVVPLEWLEANREDATRIAAKGLPWNVPPPADAKIEGEKSKKRRKLTKSRPPPRGTDSDAEAPLVGGWAFPVMVAKRDILPSEDLRYFYGDPYWYDGHPFVFPQHSHGIPTAFAYICISREVSRSSRLALESAVKDVRVRLLEENLEAARRQVALAQEASAIAEMQREQAALIRMAEAAMREAYGDIGDHRGDACGGGGTDDDVSERCAMFERILRIF